MELELLTVEGRWVEKDGQEGPNLKPLLNSEVNYKHFNVITSLIFFIPKQLQLICDITLSSAWYYLQWLSRFFGFG